MIQEAKQFDNRLKKMGIDINVDDLIQKTSDKEEGIKGTHDYDEGDEDDIIKQMEQQYKVYDSLDDSKAIDYSTLGLVDLNSQDMMRYFPRNEKGMTFSSKAYNPLGMRPKAPNSRLEMDSNDHVAKLQGFDLMDLLRHLGIVKSERFAIANHERCLDRNKFMKVLN